MIDFSPFFWLLPGSAFCPRAWFPARFPESTPCLEELRSQSDEGVNKTHTYVFLQSNSLFCFDRGSFHLDQLSEQLTVVASKLQPSLKDKIPDQTQALKVHLSALIIHTRVALQATSHQFYILTLKQRCPSSQWVLLQLKHIGWTLLCPCRCLWVAHVDCFQASISNWPFLFMALGPLIPPRARSFKATRVSRWLCCQEAPPVAGIVLYLCNKGIYREHPFAAACCYSVQLQQSCRYVTGATFLTSQGRTVTFQLKQILRPCLGFQRRKTELLENGRLFSWKLEAEMKNKWSEKWKWKKTHPTSWAFSC